MTIMVRCKDCGNEFQSQLHVDNVSFENPANRLAGITDRCPKCGQTLTYDKQKYFFKE